MSQYYNTSRKKKGSSSGKKPPKRYSNKSYRTDGGLNMWGVVQDIMNRTTRGGTSTDKRTKKHSG